MEKPVQYMIISECWLLMRKYMDITNDQEARWSEVIQKYNEIAKKYNKPFATQLCIECMNELERIAKEKEGNRNG